MCFFVFVFVFFVVVFVPFDHYINRRFANSIDSPESKIRENVFRKNEKKSNFLQIFGILCKIDPFIKNVFQTAVCKWKSSNFANFDMWLKTM